MRTASAAWLRELTLFLLQLAVKRHQARRIERGGPVLAAVVQEEARPPMVMPPLPGIHTVPLQHPRVIPDPFHRDLQHHCSPVSGYLHNPHDNPLAKASQATFFLSSAEIFW